MKSKDNEHSKLFYLVFGGFWLLSLFGGIGMSRLLGDQESYAGFLEIWKRCKKETRQ